MSTAQPRHIMATNYSSFSASSCSLTASLLFTTLILATYCSMGANYCGWLSIIHAQPPDALYTVHQAFFDDLQYRNPEYDQQLQDYLRQQIMLNSPHHDGKSLGLCHGDATVWVQSPTDVITHVRKARVTVDGPIPSITGAVGALTLHATIDVTAVAYCDARVNCHLFHSTVCSHGRADAKMTLGVVATFEFVRPAAGQEYQVQLQPVTINPTHEHYSLHCKSWIASIFKGYIQRSIHSGIRSFLAQVARSVQGNVDVDQIIHASDDIDVVYHVTEIRVQPDAFIQFQARAFVVARYFDKLTGLFDEETFNEHNAHPLPSNFEPIAGHDEIDGTDILTLAELLVRPEIITDVERALAITGALDSYSIIPIYDAQLEINITITRPTVQIQGGDGLTVTQDLTHFSVFCATWDQNHVKNGTSRIVESELRNVGEVLDIKFSKDEASFYFFLRNVTVDNAKIQAFNSTIIQASGSRVQAASQQLLTRALPSVNDKLEHQYNLEEPSYLVPRVVQPELSTVPTADGGYVNVTWHCTCSNNKHSQWEACRAPMTCSNGAVNHPGPRRSWEAAHEVLKGHAPRRHKRTRGFSNLLDSLAKEWAVSIATSLQRDEISVNGAHSFGGDGVTTTSVYTTHDDGGHDDAALRPFEHEPDEPGWWLFTYPSAQGKCDWSPRRVYMTFVEIGQQNVAGHPDIADITFIDASPVSLLINGDLQPPGALNGDCVSFTGPSGQVYGYRLSWYREQCIAGDIFDFKTSSQGALLLSPASANPDGFCSPDTEVQGVLSLPDGASAQTLMIISPTLATSCVPCMWGFCTSSTDASGISIAKVGCQTGTCDDASCQPITIERDYTYCDAVAVSQGSQTSYLQYITVSRIDDKSLLPLVNLGNCDAHAIWLKERIILIVEACVGMLLCGALAFTVWRHREPVRSRSAQFFNSFRQKATLCGVFVLELLGVCIINGWDRCQDVHLRPAVWPLRDLASASVAICAAIFWYFAQPAHTTIDILARDIIFIDEKYDRSNAMADADLADDAALYVLLGVWVVMIFMVVWPRVTCRCKGVNVPSSHANITMAAGKKNLARKAGVTKPEWVYLFFEVSTLGFFFMMFGLCQELVPQHPGVPPLFVAYNASAVLTGLGHTLNAMFVMRELTVFLVPCLVVSTTVACCMVGAIGLLGCGAVVVKKGLLSSSGGTGLTEGDARLRARVLHQLAVSGWVTNAIVSMFFVGILVQSGYLHHTLLVAVVMSQLVTCGYLVYLIRGGVLAARHHHRLGKRGYGHPCCRSNGESGRYQERMWFPSWRIAGYGATQITLVAATIFFVCVDELGYGYFSSFVFLTFASLCSIVGTVVFVWQMDDYLCHELQGKCKEEEPRKKRKLRKRQKIWRWIRGGGDSGSPGSGKGKFALWRRALSTFMEWNMIPAILLTVGYFFLLFLARDYPKDDKRWMVLYVCGVALMYYVLKWIRNMTRMCLKGCPQRGADPVTGIKPPFKGRSSCITNFLDDRRPDGVRESGERVIFRRWSLILGLFCLSVSSALRAYHDFTISPWDDAVNSWRSVWSDDPNDEIEAPEDPNSSLMPLVKLFAHHRAVELVIVFVVLFIFMAAFVVDAAPSVRQWCSCCKSRDMRSLAIAEEKALLKSRILGMVGALMAVLSLMYSFSADYAHALNMNALKVCGTHFCDVVTATMGSAFSMALSGNAESTVVPVLLNIPWTLGRIALFLINDQHRHKANDGAVAALLWASATSMTRVTITGAVLAYIYEPRIEVALIYAAWVVGSVGVLLLFWNCCLLNSIRDRASKKQWYCAWGWLIYFGFLWGLVCVAKGEDFGFGVLEDPVLESITSGDVFSHFGEFCLSDVVISDVLLLVLDDCSILSRDGLTNKEWAAQGGDAGAGGGGAYALLKDSGDDYPPSQRKGHNERLTWCCGLFGVAGLLTGNKLLKKKKRKSAKYVSLTKMPSALSRPGSRNGTLRSKSSSAKQKSKRAKEREAIKKSKAKVAKKKVQEKAKVKASKQKETLKRTATAERDKLKAAAAKEKAKATATKEKEKAKAAAAKEKERAKAAAVKEKAKAAAEKEKAKAAAEKEKAKAAAEKEKAKAAAEKEKAKAAAVKGREKAKAAAVKEKEKAKVPEKRKSANGKSSNKDKAKGSVPIPSGNKKSSKRSSKKRARFV